MVRQICQSPRADIRDGRDEAGAAPVTVEAVVHASARAVRKRIGSWASIDEVDQRSCRVRISEDTTDWAVLALGATGATFVVESPADIAAQLREWSIRFGQAADASMSPK